MSAGVTCAVVSWNTRELLAECLESLEAAVGDGGSEVWVLDNASTDGSAELVRSRFPGAGLVASERNLGFGAAVNELAGRGDGEWILAANADVRLEPGALEALLRAARDPGVGAVAPRLIGPGGETQHSVHAFPSARVGVAVALGLYRLVPALGERLCIEGFWDPERPREVDWAHGALLLLRREAFEAVGGFAPDQWLYAEDIDLQWRLREAGWKVRYEPAARAGHQGSAATGPAFGGERAARHVAATYAWLARRRGMARTWFWGLCGAGGAAIRVALLAPGAVARPRRYRPAFSNSLSYLRLHLRGLCSRAALERAAPRPSDVRAPLD